MTAFTDVTLAKLAVLDSTMAYREAGNPNLPTVLFLHGNPTSSYLWRNIISLVAPVGHCIAPDLIGFGQSGKPNIEYRFFDHVRYLDAFLDKAGITSAYVVAHDWGTALAFHLAARRPEFVRGLAFMEFIRPMPTWNDFHPDAVETFKKFRTPGVGEKMILEENVFVERVLPGATVRKLTDEEMAVYRAPFLTPESRRPTWRFPNDLPIAGKPADVYSAIEEAHHALAQASYPKLLFAGEPGALVSPTFAESFAGGLKNCRLLHIGPGLHYLPEDNPKAIGSAIREWLTELEAAAQKNTATNDFKELTDRYVAMWNETDTGRRNQSVRELWVEDGIECTSARETRGHPALESRVTASHEKNVRDGGCLFRSCNNAEGHHGLIKFNWEMFRVSDGVVQSICFA